MSENQVQVSPEFLKILEFFCNNEGWHIGSDVMRGTGLSAGTAYPMVVRMWRAGWFDRRIEKALTRSLKRGCRGYFTAYRMFGRKNAEKLSCSESSVDDGVENLEPCLGMSCDFVDLTWSYFSRFSVALTRMFFSGTMSRPV